VAAPSEGPVQGIVAPERSVSTPETLAPPFPFRSLILAYLFLIPMNFAVQVYAGSSIGERLGRRGESLLASPATARQIITGKALPYAGIMLGISAAIAWIIGGSWLSVLAMAPVVLAFLALEFMAAMVARSFRELTFLTVFISVSLTLYTFLPAVFTSVHPVALVSPITLVVLDLRHAEVPLLHMLYATLPLTVFSLALFYIGAGLYREEDLFHQKPVHAKLLDALARHVKGLGSGAKLTMITIPCVFVAELMMLTFLFAWPAPVTLGAVLLSVALVEEAFKGAPSYAALSRGKIAPRRALAFGALAGLGFFVAEKGILLASLVGLFDLPAGGAIFGGSGPVLGTTGLAQLGLLLLPPMALHVATASFTALGARFGKRAFLATFLAAGMAHAAYNYYNVVQATGGALR
jgi:ABC-type Na+ efflux pump permease subunit